MLSLQCLLLGVVITVTTIPVYTTAKSEPEVVEFAVADGGVSTPRLSKEAFDVVEKGNLNGGIENTIALSLTYKDGTNVADHIQLTTGSRQTVTRGKSAIKAKFRYWVCTCVRLCMYCVCAFCLPNSFQFLFLPSPLFFLSFVFLPACTSFDLSFARLSFRHLRNTRL